MGCGQPHETPCTEVIASLSAFVDGEVGAEQYRVIAVHITECAPCEREENAHRMVKALVVRAVGRTQASADLRARIHARFTFGRADSSEG